MTDRSLGAALVASPVLLLAAEGFSPALKTDTAEQLAVIAEHGDRWYAYTLVLLLGSIVFLPAVLGMARVARSGSPRLVGLAVPLLGYGTVIACADVMNQLTVWKAAAPAADRAQLLALLSRVDESPAVTVLYATGGLSYLVGSVLMAVALGRAPRVPTWSGIGFGTAMVLQLVGFTISSVPVLAVSALLALVSLLPAARLLLASGERRVEAPQYA